MAIVKRNKSSISGLTTDLTTLTGNINAETTARQNAIGTLSSLTTTAKTSVVAAVNEIDGAALKTANNLSELAASAGTARGNLDVYSTSEVDSAIDAAKLAIGSDYNVADITARNALTDLDLADRILVVDDGDGKWAMYRAAAVDGNGTGTSWIKLSDQDSLENALSASSIKAAYESNADTNAFTDAEKTKVAGAFVDADLADDLEVAAPADKPVSAAAAKTYADAAAVTPLLETLTVTSGQVTLTNAPKNGLSGIMNFGTVRYTDGDGIAYDAPLIATGNSLVFDVSTDTANQWDGFSVKVQYLY